MCIGSIILTIIAVMQRMGNNGGPGSISDKQRSFFLRTLAKEPQMKWEQINWCSSPQEAMSRAQATGKPIFIEIIVGRLADKTSQVC
jgi:hypothetical protein